MWQGVKRTKMYIFFFFYYLTLPVQESSVLKYIILLSSACTGQLIHLQTTESKMLDWELLESRIYKSERDREREG